jgi:hypothetical protein
MAIFIDECAHAAVARRRAHGRDATLLQRREVYPVRGGIVLSPAPQLRSLRPAVPAAGPLGQRAPLPDVPAVAAGAPLTTWEPGPGGGAPPLCQEPVTTFPIRALRSRRVARPAGPSAPVLVHCILM